MRHECYFCHLRTIEKLIEKFKPDSTVSEAFVFALHKLIEANWKMANPELAAEIHRMARSHLKTTDLYAEEKSSANEILLNKYSHWKDVVNRSSNPFSTAAKLAVIGNIIDYGANSATGSIADQVESLYRKNLKIDMTADLENQIRNAKHVLYLGDNCGEIIFDRLFIETMNHPNLTYAVRGEPVINDVTLDDAEQAGMNNICRVISNGSDAPSTILEFCSDEFTAEFYKADLIISKGQGNFEGLMDNTHPNIFFLLIAKCHPIAKLLGVSKNDMVVVQDSFR